ncbi:Ing1-like protein [Scheffersomyces xylosifermentans]|uniref:Ing1-like protein n=1 Tax=Scheffersomyces xylosifermentans TaxID=1304137 RepID=UPI00315C6378
MDTSTVLEKYTQDLSNLPLEVRHLLEEIKIKDVQVMEARKRYQTKDNQIHKFIRANGTLTKHPKEQQLYNKIEEDMQVVQKLQKEKILLANTALFLISKHLFNFETDIAKLERDELLPPVDNMWEVDGGSAFKSDLNSALNGISDSLSGTPTPRNGTASGTPTAENMRKQPQKRKQTINIRSTVSIGGSNNRPVKRLRSEEAEDRFSGMVKSSSMPGPGEHLHRMGGPMGENGPSGNGEDADNNLYCFCQRVSFGEMIGCDNDDCKYEWFHWSCVGITSPPKDDEVWYCPDCAPKMEKRKKKRKM